MLSKRDYALFFIFFFIYLSYANHIGWNDDSRILTSAAIVDSGTMEITRFKDVTGDRANFGGRYYSDKAPLSSIIGIPAYGVYRLFFPPINADIDTGSREYSALLFLFSAISSFFSAASTLLLYWCLRYITKNKKAVFLAVVGYGFGTMAFSQATIYNGHSIALFFVWLGIFIILGGKRENWFYAGASFGLGFLADYLVLLALPGAVMIMFIMRKVKIIRLMHFLLGFSLVCSFLFLYNYYVFNDPLAFSYSYVDTEIFGNDYIYMPAFIDCSSGNSTNTLNVVKNHFYNECSYKEKIIYDPVLGSVIHSSGPPGPESYLIEKTGNRIEYFHKYYTKNGVMELKEKIQTAGNISFNGKTYNGSSIYVLNSPETENWRLISHKIYENKTITLLISHSNSYLKEDCMIVGILPEEKFLRLANASYCKIGLYSEKGNEMSYMELKFSEISLDNNNGTYTLSRTVEYSTLQHDALFFWNKMIMLLFYPYRGLLFFSPVLLLFFIGYFLSEKKAKLLFLPGGAALFLLLVNNAFFSFWWGGSSYGPRFLIYALPFMFLPISKIMGRFWEKNKIVFCGLVFLSVLINLMGHQELYLSQTTAYVKDGSVRLQDSYYDKMAAMSLLDSPVFSAYLPLFLEKGPSNIVLQRALGIDLGFLNLVVFAAAVLILKKILLGN